jgi:hypothetical protein
MPEEKPIERRFLFNGSAVAFGGRIRRPDDVFLKAAAVSHLPVTGGFSESHIQGPDVSQYHYKEYLTFSEAYSRAHGDFSDPKRAADFTHGNHGQNNLPATTTVEARLHDLQIVAEEDLKAGTPKRVFFVKKLHVSMQTTSSHGAQQSVIRSLSAKFEGLSLKTGSKADAAPVGLTVTTAEQIFADNETKSKLRAKYAEDGQFRKQYASCFHPLGEGDKGFLSNLVGKHDIPHAETGPIVCTFVTGLAWDAAVPEGVEILNNRVTIPGLGRIYFGEIIVDDKYQRASLLRFELGSNVGGCATACEASSNGSHYPPGF